MKEFIFEYRHIIVYVVSMLIYGLLEYDRNKIMSLMLKAKDMAKDRILRSGADQKHYVLTKAIAIVPGFKYLPLNIQEYIINYLYNKAMDLLDDGKINNSNN